MAQISSAILDPKDPRDRLYLIIFEAETPTGKLFDVALLWLIIASVVTVALESVAGVREHYGTLLIVLEWFYTSVFTIEYGLRIYCTRRRLRYILSFFGIIDLLALLPAFISLVFTNVHSLLVIRALRLLRVFRVLKAVRLMGEAYSLMSAVRSSLPKISVFIGAVIVIALIVGSAMYLIEDAEAGFTSIPRAMYWAIVTMTTVGYGDIAPKTELGQFLAAVLMILGYGILAVPTGIVSAEMVASKNEEVGVEEGDSANEVDDQAELEGAVCHACGAHGHLPGANFCYVCGSAVD
ncbi:MAG: ion transporter [Myxococcota bacterium]